MKNIFNKLGYISKPALIGTVLGVATVAVGIGIITNFSGGASQPAKGFSGAALEQYAGDVSSQAQQQAAGYSLKINPHLKATRHPLSPRPYQDLRGTPSPAPPGRLGPSLSLPH